MGIDQSSQTLELNERLVELVIRVRQAWRVLVIEFELTDVQSRSLLFLYRGPVSSRELAEHLEIDASNITNLIDRLEERGLVRREAQPGDRRVKLLVITEAGRALVDNLQERIISQSLVDHTLSAADEAELIRLLGLVLAGRPLRFGG